MSRRIDAPPPRLTRDLTREISAEADRARGGAGPASPLDWIAARARVKKLTVRRWLRIASQIRASGITGPVAQRWTDFADAVDDLIAACSDSVCVRIDGIARDGSSKKQLDALLALQKRLDRHEVEIDASDVDVSQSEAVAHIPREILDRLSADELAAIVAAQEAIEAAVSRVDRILAEATERVSTPDE